MLKSMTSPQIVFNNEWNLVKCRVFFNRFAKNTAKCK